MLERKAVTIEGVSTEGFEAKVSSSLVEVEEGSIHFEALGKKYKYDAFSFDLEPDELDSVDVLYDVFLAVDNDEPLIELYRTELGPSNQATHVPTREGVELLHALLSIMIPGKERTAAHGSITMLQGGAENAKANA